MRIVKANPAMMPPPPVPKPLPPVIEGFEMDAGDTRNLAVATRNLTLVLVRDGAGNHYIQWLAHDALRDIITASLSRLGFDIKTSGADFDVVPEHLPPHMALLIFTAAGTEKLRSALGEFMPPLDNSLRLNDGPKALAF